MFGDGRIRRDLDLEQGSRSAGAGPRLAGVGFDAHYARNLLLRSKILFADLSRRNVVKTEGDPC